LTSPSFSPWLTSMSRGIEKPGRTCNADGVQCGTPEPMRAGLVSLLLLSGRWQSGSLFKSQAVRGVGREPSGGGVRGAGGGKERGGRVRGGDSGGFRVLTTFRLLSELILQIIKRASPHPCRRPVTKRREGRMGEWVCAIKGGNGTRTISLAGFGEHFWNSACGRAFLFGL
jgi:hypothetical protein